MSTISRIETWVYGMGKCVIGGAAATGSAWMGLAMGKSVGLEVPTLNWKALGLMLLTSSLTNLFFYLQKSPLPEPSTGDTGTINKADVPKP